MVALEHAVAGPLCTRHLADLGAEVIKVERPEGDFARHYDSTVRGLSSHFVWLNRSKQSVVLDLRQASARTALRRLVASADVFVQNLSPGAAERLGFGAATLRRRYPRLVYCSISGYGETGPYRGRRAFDLLLQAETGLLSITGHPGRPAKVGIPVADIAAGMYGLTGILAALYERRETGRGRTISISMFDTLTEWLSFPLYYSLYTRHHLSRTGLRHSAIAPYGPYVTRDGRTILIGVQNEEQWMRFCSIVLRDAALAEEKRFASNELRVRNRPRLEAAVSRRIAAQSHRSVVQRLLRADVPFAHMNDLFAVARHPQVLGRERWARVRSPAGEIRVLHHPLGLEGMPPRLDPIPALGEHTAAVLQGAVARGRRT